MDIGLQIKTFREQQKLSQEELALKIYVSRQTISNWETNKSCPDVKSLIILSKTKRTFRGSFRTRADSTTDNRAKLSGGRKKFKENVIEIWA